MSDQTSTTSGTVVPLGFDEATLRGIANFADALALAGPVESVTEYLGTGFRVLPTSEKSTLVGVPFLILEWHFSEGDQGEFVSILAVTRNDEKVIINDGSTGIKDQMHQLGDSRPLAVPGGLRSSTFYYNSTTKETSNRPREGFSPATTYYLAV